MADCDGNAAFKATRRADADVPSLSVSGAIGKERAVGSRRNGATDCVLKDNLARLAPAVSRAIREAEELRPRRAFGQATHDAESRFRELEDTIEDVLRVSSADGGRITCVNPACESVLSLSSSGTPGRKTKKARTPGPAQARQSCSWRTRRRSGHSCRRFSSFKGIASSRRATDTSPSPLGCAKVRDPDAPHRHRDARGLTGVDVATRILAERPEIPVLCTSGYAPEYARKRLRVGPEVHFLEKPFEISQFRRVVRQLLERVPA